MISVVVSIYNVKEYLKAFIDSVKAQTYQYFEAILVDDGSTDGTGELLDELTAGDTHCKVFHKKNGGCVSAWKYGVNVSQGEYITFADPDDILRPDFLKTLYALAIRYDTDLVVCEAVILHNDKYEKIDMVEFLSVGLYEGEQLAKIKSDLFGTQETQKNIFNFARWNKLFKRQLILDNMKFGREDITFGEDVCISAGAILDCNSLYYTDEVLYEYRIRDNSLCTCFFSVSDMDNAERLLDAVRAMLKAKGYSTENFNKISPSYQICRLVKKIADSHVDGKEKKRLLELLRNSALVGQYDLQASRKHISANRYWAIWLLQHKVYMPLIILGKNRM